MLIVLFSMIIIIIIIKDENSLKIVFLETVIHFK